MTAYSDDKNSIPYSPPTNTLFPTFTPPNLQPPMSSPFPGLQPQPQPVLPPFPIVYGQTLPQPLGNVGAASGVVIVNGATLKCDKAKDASARVTLVVQDKGYQAGLGHRAMDTDTKPENFAGDFGICSTDDEKCEMLQMLDRWTEVDESQSTYYNGQIMMGLTIDSLLVCTKGGGSLSIDKNGQVFQSTSQSYQINNYGSSEERMLSRQGKAAVGSVGEAYVYIDTFKISESEEFKVLNQNVSQLENHEGKDFKMVSGETTEKDLGKKSSGFDVLKVGNVGSASAVDLHGGINLGGNLLGIEGTASGKIAMAEAKDGAALAVDGVVPEVYASGSVKASMLEADGRLSVKVLGLEAGVSAEAFAGGGAAVGEVGIKEDKKFHVKFGIASGFGATVGFEIGLAD